MDASTIETLKNAFHKDDAATLRSYLLQHPELKQHINAPIGPFDSPPICNVRSKQILDVLLEAGADINAKSRWWAGGFCLLDNADDALAQYAIERGARVEVHAAARLGMVDRLRELIAAEPSLVNAPGGDGKRPLHFARNIEVAEFLLDHGAEIDVKDIDHESTPARHLIDEHQDVVCFLIERGAKTDLFMTAALGDVALVTKYLDANPNSIRSRIDDQTFPMSNPRAGGTIYFWTLGREFSPHQVAHKFKREAVLKLLLDRSPREVQFINYCWLNDEPAVKQLLAGDPSLVGNLSATEKRAPADAARDRKWPELRLMLDAGFPVDARGQHQGTLLHWAAWHGNTGAVADLLKRGAPIDLNDADFNVTPLQWAMHASEHGWRCDENNYAGVAKLLLEAGAKIPEQISGTHEVQEAVRSLTR